MRFVARYANTARLIVVVALLLLAGLQQSMAIAWDATPTAGTPSAGGDAPIAIEFPRDDGQHNAPIEWWYYTGHLTTELGDRYGFEFVVFKGQRGSLTAYSSHFAITDSRRGQFRYAERLVVSGTEATPFAGSGFDLRVNDWSMGGTNGQDRLVASMPGFAITLQTTSDKPPVLHDGDGYIDYGSAGGSYYYSRTRQMVEGVLTVDGQDFTVDGLAWMDHQWGDFETFDRGGWDWFSVQLDDGWDLMLYVVHSPDGQSAVVDGSLVAPDGSLTVLDEDDFATKAIDTWTSSATGVTYPSGWIVSLPAEDLVLTLTPTLHDQELDTTVSTGQIYWEGEVVVEGTRAGQPVSGLGYVELTGYADGSEKDL